MMTFQLVTLLDRVAHEFNVAPADILGGSRQVDKVDARGVAVYCARHLWGTSYERLGACFSRSKSSAHRLEQKIVYRMEYDKRTIQVVNRIMEMEATI